MPLYELDGKRPVFENEETNWVAPDATVIGDVTIGRNASLWFGVVIRGDNEPIRIGADTNIQEHTVMHTDPGSPLTIGEGCTIGHRAMLHGCTIGDGSLVGMGAIVLNGARIGRNSLVRTLDDNSVAGLRGSAAHYVANGARFRKKLKKI